MMTREEIFSAVFLSIAKDAPHPNYARTVKLAKEYKAIVTGEDLDGMMKRFARRESEEAFQQRKDITEHVLKGVSKSILDVFYKIPRANYLRIVGYSGQNKENQTKELESRIGTFWGEMSVDDYMATRWIELNAIDPNAFVVIEFDKFDATKDRAKPYPFEVQSWKAWNYSYQNHILQYLLVKQPTTFKEQDGKEWEGHVYTCYMENDTVQLIEVKDNVGLSAVEYEIQETAEAKYVVLNKKAYRIVEFTPHNAHRVPAFRVGAMRDMYTDGTSRVNLFDAAVPHLKKTLKVNSELDLTMAMTAFPLTIRYDEPCDAAGCLGGTLHDGSSCSVCHGTGMKKRPTSVQEEITLPIPDNKDDAFDLEKILVYKTPPVELLQFQDEYIERLSGKAKRIVFNSDIFSRSEIAETATGKNIDLQNVYDALWPVARKFARDWEFIVDMIATFTQLNKDLVRSLTFSKDFKLKSKSELLDDLKMAKDADAGPDLKRAIQSDIMRLVYSDDPIAFKKYLVKEEFNPFSGMTQEEIAIALAGNLVPEPVKVLYSNFGYIFDELEMQYAAQNQNFYDLKRDKQRAAIMDKVNEIMNSMAPAQPILGQVDTEAGRMPGQPNSKLLETVGGVQGIIGVSQAVAEKKMTEKAGINVLIEIYGFTEEVAKKLIDVPDDTLDLTAREVVL